MGVIGGGNAMKMMMEKNRGSHIVYGIG